MASQDPLRPVRGSPRQVLAALRGWLERPDGPLVVRTSGSSGRPRDVVLSYEAVTASARAAMDRLGGPGQWLLDLPVNHVAGLQVLVRSLLAGRDPVVAAGPGSFGATVAALDGQRCYTALVPTQLHRLAADGALDQLRRFDAVLVGGAALRPDLLARCEDTGIAVVATYGLSETCGGCVYGGVPLDGVSVRVDPAGRVELSGPVLFDGYAGDRELTAQVLRDGWLRTSDLGHLERGRLEVLGRIDDVVVSGGVNVALPAVTRVLLDLPGVEDAVAVGVDDPEWGARVVACMVCTASAPTPALDVVRDSVARSLPRTWAPRAVVRLDTLPLLPGGKLDRLALSALAAADA